MSRSYQEGATGRHQGAQRHNREHTAALTFDPDHQSLPEPLEQRQEPARLRAMIGFSAQGDRDQRLDLVIFADFINLTSSLGKILTPPSDLRMLRKLTLPAR
jgi:hypothetical protein